MKMMTADNRKTYWQIHLLVEYVLPATSACSDLSAHCVTIIACIIMILLYEHTEGNKSTESSCHLPIQGLQAHCSQLLNLRHFLICLNATCNTSHKFMVDFQYFIF
jgi:hypothetical protein